LNKHFGYVLLIKTFGEWSAEKAKCHFERGERNTSQKDLTKGRNLPMMIDHTMIHIDNRRS
jgi:hypothetical protein